MEQNQQATVSQIETKPDTKLKNPIFKPFQVSKNSQKDLQNNSNSEFIQALRDMKTRIKASTSTLVAPETPQTSQRSVNIIEKDSDSDVQSQENQPIQTEEI
ncbi:hypothetical protein P3X46_035045, partial [Hevea brasiliensis]